MPETDWATKQLQSDFASKLSLKNKATTRNMAPISEGFTEGNTLALTSDTRLRQVYVQNELN